MIIGQYYQRNRQKLALVTEAKWREALAKCERHIEIKLRQKTLYGVHAASNLGADPVDHYMSLAYEKIISGEWEFQDGRDISEQLIRIINSYISKAVEHSNTKKAETLKIKYDDIESEFYEREYNNVDIEDEKNYSNMIAAIGDAVKGDIELEIIWDAIKEGKERAEIADLLDKTPRQFDKLREKLMKLVKKQQPVG